MTGADGGDRRRFSQATESNRDVILEVLVRVLPRAGTVLEIASGAGEHATHFAAGLGAITWQPSDVDAGSLASIAAWAAAKPSENLLPAVVLDVTSPSWPDDARRLPGAAGLCAIVNINMLHISSWATCQGLMRGAGELLPAGGVLFIYGPFSVGGQHTAPSNAAFDSSLRARDPSWGVRDRDDVAEVAREHGLELAESVPMPANNFSLVFRKRPGP